MIATKPKPLWAAKPFLVAYAVAVAFTVGVLIDRSPSASVVSAMAGDAAERGERDAPPEPPLWQQVFRPSQLTARWLLRMGLPMLTVADGSAQEAARRELLLQVAGHYGEQKPQTLFQSVLPFLRPDHSLTDQEPSAPPDAAGSEPPPVARPPATPGKPPEEAATLPVAGGQPLVGIYHTHDWESYVSEFPAFTPTTKDDLGKIVSEDHKKRTIMGVGKALALRLTALGVSNVYADYTHRENGYLYAYRTSRTTARDILKQYPTVKVLVDLHRDEGWQVDTKAKIKGQDVAKVRCIIGTGNQGWERNKLFCDKLTGRLEAKYPGITLPTRIQGDTYNQDLMSGAILLEIGGALNHFAEAERSAGYLAEVMAEMIRDGEYPKD